MRAFGCPPLPSACTHPAQFLLPPKKTVVCPPAAHRFTPNREGKLFRVPCVRVARRYVFSFSSIKKQAVPVEIRQTCPINRLPTSFEVLKMGEFPPADADAICHSFLSHVTRYLTIRHDRRRRRRRDDGEGGKLTVISRRLRPPPPPPPHHITRCRVLSLSPKGRSVAWADVQGIFLLSFPSFPLPPHEQSSEIVNQFSTAAPTKTQCYECEAMTATS